MYDRKGKVMKRFIAMIMLLALMLPLGACKEKEQDPNELPELAALGDYDFYAGFGRENITPLEPVPLGGYGRAESRMHQAVLEDLYVDCLALTDTQGETILLMNWDGVRAYTEIQQMVRENIYAVLGIPTDHIFIGATHSHSCPEMTNKQESAIRYTEYVIAQATACALEALRDRKPANMSAGSIETESMNFVRHYKTTLPDGSVTYFGDNFNSSVYNETTTHTSEADPTMFMLYFTRDGGEDLAFTNWRAHPHFTGGASKYDLSADWCGAFHAAFEYQTGIQMIYFNGAAGNINEKSRVETENRTADYEQYGAILADYAMECMENNLKPVKVDKIQTAQTMFEGQVNHTTDDLYNKSREIQAVWVSTGDSTLVKEMGAPYGIRSPYHANAIVTRYNLDETEQRELNVILLGDSVSLVTAPNELFDTNSQWLEENSPTEFTLTLGYTNGHYGYIPSALAWEYTSYETDITYFVPGTGEKYQECFLSMLNELTDN